MERIPIEVSTSVLHQNTVWYFATEFNGLYMKNLDTGIIQECGSVPWEDMKQRLLYANMFYSNNKIILVPFEAETIAIYDIVNRSFLKVELDSSLESVRMKFQAAYCNNDYVLMFGFFAPTILRLDTKTLQCEYYDAFLKKMPFCDDKMNYFRKQLAFEQEKLWVPFSNANAILEINLKTFDMDVFTMSTSCVGFDAICNVKESIYLFESGPTPKIVSWNKVSHDEKVVGTVDVAGRVSAIYYDSEKITIYVKTKKTNIFENFDKIVFDCNRKSLVGETVDVDSIQDMESLELIFLEKGMNSEAKVTIPEIACDATFLKNYFSGTQKNEGKYLGLEKFVEFIKNGA